jgi:ribose transport system ATP-binding protein
MGEGSGADTSLLVLDEATASIPEAATGQFLGRAKRIAEQGAPVVMVTHRMREVLEYADRITMLVNGSVVFSGRTADTSEEQLVDLMVVAQPGAQGGRARGAAPVASPGATAPRRTASAGAPAHDGTILVRGLRTETLRGIDLALEPGAILGVVGGPESGAGDIPAALVGDHPGASGRIERDGRIAPLPRSPREALDLGIVLVPRDRLHGGGVATLSVRENALLPGAASYWHRRRRADAAVRKIYEQFDVQPPDPSVAFGSLSGGNQQKVVIGKWLSVGPRVLVLDDPTQGVDPGARRKIFDVLLEETRNGLSVVLLSTEPEQIVQLCTRVVALEDGEVVDELAGGGVTRAAIARWAA